MKRIITVVISIIFLFNLNACKKIDRLTQFNITIEEEIEVPSIIGINLPINIPTFAIHSDVNEQLEINDQKKERIERIFLEELHVSMISPADQDFNFLKAINIYISAENLSEILVAKEEDLKNENAQELLIHPIEDLDLTAYIKKDKIDLRVEIVTDETLFKKLNLSIKSIFWVDAKVLGI